MLNTISKTFGRTKLLSGLVLVTLFVQASVWAGEGEGGHEGGVPAAAAAVKVTPVESIPVGHVIKIKDLPKDFLLPAKLWDQLLIHEVKGKPAAAAEGEKGGEAKGAEGGEKPAEGGETTMSNVLFASVLVTLTEKNPGVLKEPIISFDLPKGGGEIDLSQWTTGVPGTFFVKFQLPSGETAPGFEAYHLSKTRKRKVEGRIYGGGCRFFYKITKIILKSDDKRGIAVNTTRDFHVSTLGGHFFFSWADPEAVNVTQVRFTASALPDLFCNGVAKDAAKEEDKTEAKGKTEPQEDTHE